MPNASSESHFDKAILRRFSCAELTGEERERVAAHVSRCEHCASICRRFDNALAHVFRDLDEFAPAVTEPTATRASVDEATSVSGRRRSARWKLDFLPSWIPERLAYAAVLILFVGGGGVLLLIFRPPPSETILRDGIGDFKLSRGGRLRVPRSVDLTDDWKMRIQSALVTGRPAELPAIDAVLQPLRSQSALLGTPQTDLLALLSPVNCAVMRESIAFRWTSVPGAEGYLLRLQAGGDFQWQTNVSRTTNFILHATQILRSGQTYEWSVETRINARSHIARPQRFYVLDAAASAEVRRLEGELRSSSLTLGVVYAAYGMVDEAEKEFEKLLVQNPENPSVKLWLETIARRRHATQ